MSTQTETVDVNCYNCKYVRPVAGDHSVCCSYCMTKHESSLTITIDGNIAGDGYLSFPGNYNPMYIIDCNRFKQFT